MAPRPGRTSGCSSLLQLSVVDLHDRGSGVRFWRRQPVMKRLEAVELLRQGAHAYDPRRTVAFLRNLLRTPPEF